MSFQAIAGALFRAHFRSRPFLSAHLLLWSYFLIQRSNWNWDALHTSMGLYAEFLALYLCAGVLSNEFKSRNAELILLRGISPARLYWYHSAAALSLGTALVLAAGCVFFASIPADQRIVYVLVRGWLGMVLTVSLAFLFGSFLQGYLNSPLAFLVLLLGDAPAMFGVIRGTPAEYPPLWAAPLPPIWHLAALTLPTELQWVSLTTHVWPVILYCTVCSFAGAMLFRRLGTTLFLT